jgi:NAD(P)-dependent dehydrogenase (short-subunit alcohol dehydrogenase family)
MPGGAGMADHWTERDGAQVDELFRRICGQCQKLDVLINNAGVMEQRCASIDQVDVDTLRKSLEVDALGPMMFVHYAAPLLKQSQRPVVANISSRMGSMESTGPEHKEKHGAAYGYRHAPRELRKHAR